MGSGKEVNDPMGGKEPDFLHHAGFSPVQNAVGFDPSFTSSLLSHELLQRAAQPSLWSPF